MVSSNFLRIFNVLRELNRRRTIPAIYWKALEERLFITFKTSAGRLKRGKTPRSKEEYRLQYKEKKAQKVYLEILKDYPHIYVPFILAIPPKSCERFDLGEFRRNYDLTDKIDLRDDVRAVLEDIAMKEGFNQNSLYRLLVQSLFPQVSCQVQIVNVHFLEQKDNGEVEVMVLPVNTAAETERSLEQRRQTDVCDVEFCDAGFKEDGTFQSCKLGSMCPNTTMGGTDEYPYFYCSQEHYHQLRLRKRRLEYREAMLDFYWNAKGRNDFRELLQDCGLTTHYRYLRTMHFLDAADNYGESIPALLLVDGWHTKRLLVLIGLAVSISVVVTALAAAIGQSINMGLTAGSYTFALVAILIAVLSFFSAIL